MRYRQGSFNTRITCNTLTVNQNQALPNKSGVTVIAELPESFNAVVPLQGNTSFPTQTVAGAIGFTLSSAVKSACAKTTYRLTANGVSIPTFTGFTEAGDSLGYDNRSGILNVITFEWDGVTAWYRVHQAKFALPTLSTIAITFPSRNAKITQDGTNTNVYSNNGLSAEGFTAFMTSAQTIPAGKSGRVTFRGNQLTMVGFNNTNTLEDFNGYEYAVYGNSDNLVYTVVAGINGSTTVLNSGISIGTGLIFYRLTRSSSGVVTAETSTNGTSWTLVRTFAQTFTGQLWVNACLAGNTSTRSMELMSFEIEP